MADQLTGSVGWLPNGDGRRPATAWLQADVTDSFGAVKAQCNFVQKFPRASVPAKHCQRGNALTEAY